MPEKPTDEELEKRVKTLEREAEKHRRVEAALRESEKKFKAIFDQAFQFVGLMTVDGIMLEVNRTALEFGGITAEDVLDKPFWEAAWWTHSADQQERLKDAIHRAARGRVVRFEAFHPGPDDTTHYVDITINPIKNEKGDVVFLMPEGRNITERKQAEQAHLHFFKSMELIDRVIRQETDVEQMLRKVIDQVFSIFECDRAWLLYPCDPEAPSFKIPIEQTKPEYPGALVLDLEMSMTPDAARDCQEALDANGPLDYGPGCERPLQLDAVGQFSVQTQMIMAIYPKIDKPWLFGMHQCAYARKWTAEEKTLFKEIGRRISDSLSSLLFFRDLKESEEKFRTIMTSARDGIIMIDDKGKVSYWSRAAETIFGYSSTEIMGQELHTILVPPESHGAYKKAFTAFISSDTGQIIDKTIELTAVKKGGAEIGIELSISAVRKRGQWNAVAIVRDITARKKAEQEKERLEAQLHQARRLEAVGTLAGGIAHDFNNLLMGIQGRTSLMLSGKESANPDYEHLKGIEDYVKRASDLTRQLLGFSRGGKYEVKLTDLNNLLRKSSEMFGRTKKEIKIHSKYQANIWPVAVDRGQIDQVLLNLFVNAWQSMPGGGSLYLETENSLLDHEFAETSMIPPGKYVKITVADSGVGMDQQTRERIFEPFFTTKEMGRGTGLGLASVYGIIRNHHGIIDVHSEISRGAEFRIYLPASEEKIPKERIAPDEIVTGTETILLIDDEAMILDVGKQMLRQLGYNVIISPSGKEAIQFFISNRDAIDLVILDLVMPEMSGSETFDGLKEINPAVKVLLSSGYSINGQARELIDRGCDGFIQKPFRLNELSQKIRETLAG